MVGDDTLGTGSRAVVLSSIANQADEVCLLTAPHEDASELLEAKGWRQIGVLHLN